MARTRLVNMSDDEDGELGGDSNICDNTGECSGVVKGDDSCDVRGDDGGSILWEGGFTLVRGASVGVCDFCNSEVKLLIVCFVAEVKGGSSKV